MNPSYSVSKILWIWTPHVKNEGKSIFPITIHYVNKYPLLDFIAALSSLEGMGSNAEDAEALAAVSAKHNSSALRSIMYSFIPRNGNSVAHLLARHAKELSLVLLLDRRSPFFFVLCSSLWCTFVQFWMNLQYFPSKKYMSSTNPFCQSQ